MTTCSRTAKRALWIAAILLTKQTLWGQYALTFGMLPEINLTTQISDRFELNNELTSRLVFWDNEREQPFAAEYVLTDVNAVLSTRVGISNSFNAGYQWRFRDGALIHRLIQQFNVISNPEGLRLGHRFALDQTFAREEPPQFRTRYRLTVERPLSGDRVDLREFYLEMGSEFLWIYQAPSSDLEIRLLPSLGYEISEVAKLEISLDYRLSQFLTAPPDHEFWLGLNWFYTIE